MNGFADRWLVTQASVRGASHKKTGVDCEDSCAVAFSANREWLVAAASDGAGSAPRAKEGASLVADSLARQLASDLPKWDRADGGWLKDRIHGSFLEVRARLRARGKLAEFHCTVVGVLIGPTGGLFFHVGDGAAIAAKVVEQANEKRVSYWNTFVLSAPENGEYINETFFITQNDWDKHLRKTLIPADTDIIVLMSDGAMPFTVRENRPYYPFLEPLIEELATIPDEHARNAKLAAYLASPELDRVTDDDKTLVIIFDKKLKGYRDWSIVPSHFTDAVPEQSSSIAPLDPAPDQLNEGERIVPELRRSIVCQLLPYTSIAALILSLVALLLSLIPYLVKPSHSTASQSVQPGKMDVAPARSASSDRHSSAETSPQKNTEDHPTLKKTEENSAVPDQSKTPVPAESR